MQRLLPGHDVTVGAGAQGRLAARRLRRQAAEQQGIGAVEAKDYRRAADQAGGMVRQRGCRARVADTPPC